MVSIDVHDASVDFPIFDAKSRSLKHTVLGVVGGNVAANDRKVVVIEALHHINLHVSEGDRLALGVVTSIDPEILLLDEGIGAVDAAFLEKSKKRLRELVDRAGLLVFASHSDEFLRELCDTAIWMEHGRVRQQGELEEVLRAYKGHP